MSPFGPAIKVVAYLAVALSSIGMVLAAVADDWWVFGFCTIVSLVGVRAVAKIWAADLPVIPPESNHGDWKALLADLEDTARQVPQQSL